MLRIVTLSSKKQNVSPPSSKMNSKEDKNESSSLTSDGGNVYEFRIIKNCGGGNCLFFTLDEFLHKKGDKDFISDEDKIRKAVVDYITKPDRLPRSTAGGGGNNKGKISRNNKAGKNNNNNDTTTTTTKYSNWKRYRQEIKINLEDHVRFFKLYHPSDDDDHESVEEEKARNHYKKYMKRSGVYGTSAELLAAVENFGFTATIIAQDCNTTEKFVVYHLDGMRRRGSYQTRKSRIYIYFTGHSTKGHFQLLEPVTPFRSENPSPLPSGQYRVQGKCGHPDDLTLTICEDVKKISSDKDNNNNNHSPTNDHNEDDLKTTVKDVKEENLLKRKLSNLPENFGDDAKNGRENQKNSKNDDEKPIQLDDDLVSSFLNENEEDEEDESTIEKLILDRHHLNEDDDPDSKNTMKLDPILVQSIEKTLMSSEEFTTILGGYCSKLIELQSQVLSGLAGGLMATDWSGIKVSNVWSICKFHTNFILFQPKARKPMSQTNFRTHFVVYNQDSISLTVETDIQTKRRSLFIQNVFSLDEGKYYSLENKSDHHVLMRVWWVSEHSIAS